MDQEMMRTKSLIVRGMPWCFTSTTTNTKRIYNVPVSPNKNNGIRGARDNCYWEWSYILSRLWVS